MATTPESPALQFLRLAWGSQGYQQGHSWDRLNRAMSATLGIAIKCGFEFGRHDFAVIEAHPANGGFNFGYWAGTDGHMLGERFYSLAVAADEGPGPNHSPNRSAALAFEAWRKRKPYLIRRAPSDRSPARIAVGVSFTWYAEKLTCTSFSEAGGYLTACSYKPADYQSCPKCGRCLDTGRTQVRRRVRIDHAAIREYHNTLRAT